MILRLTTLVLYWLVSDGRLVNETRTLWDQDQTVRDRDRVQLRQLHLKVTQIGMFYLLLHMLNNKCWIIDNYYEVNDKPEMDFAFKMISK